jgi:hypothetical protein
MKKIENLEDLKYRKLYIRTEIFRKEQIIKRQLGNLKKELSAPAFKNEIVKGIVNNPSMVINVARITYQMVQKWKKRRRKRKKSR